MKLIIGCPIYKRDWIIPEWIKCIINQSIDMRDVGFMFETSPDDPSTTKSLLTWRKLDKRFPLFEINERSDIQHFEHQNNGRQWTMSKYHNMVSLRNSLLSRVREYKPDFYFSLDSDVLLRDPNTIELLIAHIKDGADAVAPLMFMTPNDSQYPSVMSWKDQGFEYAYRKEKYPLGTYFKSDVIMAAKMMSKDVYNNVDYEFNKQGEDVGWSKAATQKGYNLFSASYIYSPHIMSPMMHQQYLTNGDSRGNINLYQV